MQSVNELCEKGNSLSEVGMYQEALSCFKHALEITPETYDYEDERVWILVAIGDTLFQLQQYSNGIKSNSHGHLWCNNNNWRCIGDEESPHCEGNSITVHLAVGRQFALNCLPTEYTSIVSLKSLLPIF